MLINLIGNAVKFTSAGWVKVFVRREASNLVRFEVVDTGPGIPAAMHKAIFEPFQQGLMAETAGGTGLGLTIAQKQVGVMGGEILVESPPEGGTRFHFSIPLPPALRASADATREVERLAPGCAVRALIVDDIFENREILFHLLHKAGCEAWVAINGAEAIEAVREHQPDVIFMDMRLPGGMGGLDVIRHLQQQRRPSDKKPKIIAFSASAFDHEKARYLQEGCDDFIAKPFRVEQVFAALAHLLPVTFVYRSPDESEDQATVIDLAGIPLPEDLVDRMVVAGELHSATVLKKCLKEMEALGPEEKRLAVHMRDFLARCDMTAIQRIIAQIPVKAEAIPSVS